ncbi:MAG TPA: flavodoxin [Roseomonas sp.]|nr:flavodoxin [Roseomonas sp.]
MSRQNLVSPRRALPVGLLWSLAAGWVLSTRPSRAQTAGSGSRTLVAYFSRTGNTRVIAGQVRRARDADLFEIRPSEPYPEDYEATVAQARQERDSGYEPPLAASVPDIAAYDTVFLGMPIWGGTAPSVIRSFLSAHDLSGKTLVPFITHGGYGRGQSMQVIRAHAPRAKLLQGFTLEADQERRTLETVTRWLRDVPSGR